MSIIERIETVLHILTQLFFACLPVYIVLVFLEKQLDKLGRRLSRFDIITFLDNKRVSLQEREHIAWDKRARIIDEREEHDKDISSNT